MKCEADQLDQSKFSSKVRVAFDKSFHFFAEKILRRKQTITKKYSKLSESFFFFFFLVISQNKINLCNLKITKIESPQRKQK